MKRLDAIFDIERAVNGRPATERLVVRQELSAPLITELPTCLTGQRDKLSRNHDLTKLVSNAPPLGGVHALPR